MGKTKATQGKKARGKVTDPHAQFENLPEGEYERIITETELPEWVHTFIGDKRPLVTISFKPAKGKKGEAKTTGKPKVTPPAEGATKKAKNGRSTSDADEIAGTITPGTYSVKHPDFTVTYETLDEAYSSYDHRKYDTYLDDSLSQATSQAAWMSDQLLSVPFKDGSGRIFLGSDWKLGRDIVSYEYHVWLNGIVPYYRANPDSWAAAYLFVKHHPCFWTHAEPRGEYKPAPYDWTTDEGIKRLYSYVTVTDGKPTVYMETGAHVPQTEGFPDMAYTIHYADYELSVEAPSFDEGLVKLARRIAKFFNDDGTDKRDAKRAKADAKAKAKAEALQKKSKKAKGEKARAKGEDTAVATKPSKKG